MRKAFDANVPKLKPRLRPAMAVVSDAALKTHDENANLTIEQPASNTVIAESDDVSVPDTVESISAVNDCSASVTNDDVLPQTSPQNEIQEKVPVTIREELKAIVSNIVQFPDTTLRKDDSVQSNAHSQDFSSLKLYEASGEDQLTISKMAEAVKTDIADEQGQPVESLQVFKTETMGAGQHVSISPEVPVRSVDDEEARRKRLEEVKRKVTEAVRPEVPEEPVPEDPNLAVESVLGLVSDLEAQLFRSRELEKTLRNELMEARAELARTVNDGRTASGRLVQAETQLDEKRKVLEEMLFEMGALEEERDQAVRMVQMLTAKDEGRQLEFDKISERYTEVQRALEESKAEEGRLTDELDESIAENARMHALLAEVTQERDSFARNVEKLIRERDELTEAKKALEKVHHALSQARARLRE
ncbi:MAG TPA: hypothetical protein VHO70_24685 [Chitinispirillaceae bacterium]|nr:hypothetical protein [Chitinispirillaceae bacterium]